MLKKELRLNFLHLRQNLTNHQYKAASTAISERCLELPVWDSSRYHLFLPISEKREVDTAPLLKLLKARKKEIVVPKVAGKQDLSHFLLTPETRFETNSWGIPEPVSGEEIAPETLDVIFLPLLAFDRKGNRVGYGGGYYDRFLSRCRKDVKAVGLSFFDPVETITDVHPGDRQLDFAVTPARIYEF